MANFDSNQWYQLYVNEDPDTSLYGSNLYDKNLTTGTVFFNSTHTDKPGYRWQIYSIDNTYVLRNQDGGPQGFLGTKYDAKEPTPGQTRGQMVRGNVSDASVYWTISPWGDGTFYLTNDQNGTEWHLLRKGNAGIAMSSNITEPQDGQRFSFKTITAINDQKMSTVNLPTSTATSPSSQTATNPPPSTTPSSSPSPPPSPSSGGLSTGAKAGIGAGVGIAALIALVVIGLVFWRRRKRNAPYKGHTELESNDISKQNAYPPDPIKYEMNSAATHEMQGNDGAQHELPTSNIPTQHQAPSELPGSTVENTRG
ncbi:hypothetical protein BCR34DRAFT_601019 [Clohesyomyces aquaticus]|uniref:Ricin B lectin domain-containing protein n=1 Tax=Clohesyomyces aquaticus TaxID=1231657 RepID=A0A1Y1ZNS3_9PLEO|nr:hypothetical protein BCR34DRAFT_601019 [Clohesyomyces aquaticus]